MSREKTVLIAIRVGLVGLVWVYEGGLEWFHGNL